MFKEYFKIAVKNLRTRQLRSWLTILGIVIGVFLIMSLLSLSQGLKNTILNQLRAVGTNIVIIMPGSISDMMTTTMGGAELSEEDLKAVRKTKGVELVVLNSYKSLMAKSGDKSKSVIVMGLDIRNALDLYKSDMGMKIKDGRWPVAGRKEIVVGSLVPTDVFPGLKMNETIIVKGKKFEVVGILESMGSKTDDSMIGMDINIYQSLTGEKNTAPQVVARIASGYDINEVAKDIKANLEENAKRKIGQEESSYSVLTSESLSSMVSGIMGIIQVVIFVFGGIAVLVGGIGIMNTMYTSVRERTREIGILKAIGAKNNTIVMIFLMEAGIIGLIGGIGGMIPGLGLAKIIEFYGQIHPLFYIEASITPGIILFGLLFSFGVGCLSGFLPARSASKLKPVDALRYE
jgi:putative ABC transport system permease protein